MKAQKIVGIDLGTTNSLVAFVNKGQPAVLKSREGQTLVPSVVSVIDGVPTVGYAAKKMKVREAANTAFSVKRLLGRGFADLKEAATQVPYEIIQQEGADSIARIRLGDRAFTAIEISAMILRELKAAAEGSLGEPITQAVITVPAYFNDSQRQATRAAGRLAGLDVLRIINEPTAAALAYGWGGKKQGTIAVYDLGGGTFDVSILKLHDGIFEVLATHGNTSLGGDDLDQAIVKVAAADIQDRYEFDALADINTRASLIEAAEGLKIQLSTQEKAVLRADLGVQGMYEKTFTRAQFDELVRPILEKTREACEQALKDAGLKAEDLSDVVMVGGPTRLKVVQDVARSIFKREPNASVHPDEVVAVGAAIQADILAGNNQDLLLLDVVPLSLGLETYGGLMSTLISRNTRIPTTARETFTTFVDNQTGVDVHVLQGERDRAEDNRSLARFKLKGIAPQPAGFPRVEVTFLIDADGILDVTAKDLKTGLEQTIEVRPSFGLTDTEVERMLQESQDHAESDVAMRRLVDARNDGETMLRSTEKNLEAASRLLPQDEADLVDRRYRALKAAVSGKDIERIQETSRQLSQATTRLAELVLKEALNQARS